MAADENVRDEESALAGLAARPLLPSDQEAIARLLAHSSKPLRLRAATLLAEALCGDAAPTALRDRLLGHRDAAVRWGAAFASSRAGSASPLVLDVAIEALDVEDGDVRWAAASIVTAEARLSDDLRVRLRALSSDGSPRSRKMALLCLCDSGVVDGALYRRALGDEDPFVRLAAVTCLARSGDTSAGSLSALRAVSDSDPDMRVRRGAAAVLSRLAPPGT